MVRPATDRARASAVPAAAALVVALAAAGCADVADPGTSAAAPVPMHAVAKAPLQSAKYDENGDGNEDLVWWSSATGGVAVWRMNGTSIGSTRSFGSGGSRPFSVRPQLTGVDACPEDVYRGASSAVVVNYTVVAGACGALPSPIEFSVPGWSLVDVEGSYDGSGRNHLLWRNTVGTVAIWALGSNGAISTSGFPATAPTEWSIVDGRGDYDGDGRSDILWRNAAGTVAIWRMTSLTAIAGTAFFGTAPPSAWTLVDGAGDYDGDRRSDLLWLSSTGTVVVWRLNVAAQTFTATTVGSVAAGLRVLDASTDLDGDGRSDVVWQSAAGEVVIWLMNGTSIKQARSLGVVGGEWRLVARNAP